MSSGQLKVNGRAITIAGANRHEHDDEGGKVVPLESMVQDALLMKRFNFNAVRTSHYPNHPFFYEVMYFRLMIFRVLRAILDKLILLMYLKIKNIKFSNIYQCLNRWR